MKFLIVNSKENYTSKLQKVREACAAGGVHVDLWDAESKEGIVDRARSEGYAALLHRNEHGKLFADGSFDWVREAVSKGLPVISTDFGYFDHYKTCSFDFYRRSDLSSGILDEWATLPDKVDWSAVPSYVRKHRASCLERIARADGSAYAGKVGIWMQWGTELLRKELRIEDKAMEQWEWINRLCRKVADMGLQPVVKMNIVDHSDIYQRTVPKVDSWIPLVCDRPKIAGSNDRAHYDPEANWKLLAGCSYHIILCSSVSHLMVYADRPVIATGQSWFTSLGVFQEPVGWDTPLARPSVNHAARARWANWWIGCQGKWVDAPKRLLSCYEKARNHFSSP